MLLLILPFVFLHSTGWISEEGQWKNEIPVWDTASRRTPLPDSYNVYVAYPMCDEPPEDQGNCGVCWIFSVTHALRDRFCIGRERFGGGINVTHLSAQYMASCYAQQHPEPYGPVCDGGKTSHAIEMLYPDCIHTEGTTCGTVYNDCWRYGRSIPPCPTNNRCPHRQYDWIQDRLFAVDYRSPTEGPRAPMRYDIQAMKDEIYHHGPIVVGFDAYNDIFDYTGGLYVSNQLGTPSGHAVSVVGWGTGERDYWILRNSWGLNWGMRVGQHRGYIHFAQNQYGVEGNPYAPCPLFDCEGATDATACQDAANYCLGGPRPQPRPESNGGNTWGWGWVVSIF